MCLTVRMTLGTPDARSGVRRRGGGGGSGHNKTAAAVNAWAESAGSLALLHDCSVGARRLYGREA